MEWLDCFQSLSQLGFSVAGREGVDAQDDEAVAFLDWESSVVVLFPQVQDIAAPVLFNSGWHNAGSQDSWH